jgi:hypothetical protein
MSPDINPSRSLATADLLDAVPVRNRAVECEREADSELVLRVPLRRRWYMDPPVGWLFPFSRYRRVALDRLGKEVWQGCDGERTTESIVEGFAARHHLSFHEARLSVMQFLKDLTQRGLVVMVGRNQEMSA